MTAKFPAPHCILLALALLFAWSCTESRFVDPDLFHELALARVIVQTHEIPTRDLFAYTPTIPYSVHHEWGAGVILYTAVDHAGALGLLAVKYCLAFLLALFATQAARRRGAGVLTICLCAPLAIFLERWAISTVRAELFSLAFCAILLCLMASPRKHWLLAWLALYVLWLNIHAGFAVGVGLLALFWLENLLRGRGMQWPIVAAGVAMAGLFFVNPFGYHYATYLFHALAMPRPAIGEWSALWQRVPSAGDLIAFGLALLIALYALLRNGWRQMPGILMLAASAGMAILHVRHIPIYAVVWFACVPAWLQQTPLAVMSEDFWLRHRRSIAAVSAILAILFGTAFVVRKPWQVWMPTTAADIPYSPTLIYPASAVDSLRAHHFTGNVMTPFEVGAYVSWELWPSVKVSMDGRYEVAYAPGLMEEIGDFYRAKPGWQATLNRYPTDLVLVRRDGPLLAPLSREPGWHLVYEDDVYALVARPGMTIYGPARENHAHKPRFP